MEGIAEEGKPDGGEEGEEKVDKGKASLLPLKGPFVCTVDEINEAFNWVKSVRYSQPIVLSGTSAIHVHLTHNPGSNRIL